MHMVVGVFVYANSEDEALENATKVYKLLCGEWKRYDYYVLFNRDTGRFSGRGRWGDVPVTLQLNSPIHEEAESAQRFIEERMGWGRQDFVEDVNKLRQYLERFTNDELYNEHAPSLFSALPIEERPKHDDGKPKFFVGFRYHCYAVGGGGGAHCWLYDQDGEAIDEPTHLGNVLSRWAVLGKDSRIYDKGIWIVPADVHY